MERSAANFRTGRALIGWIDEQSAAALLRPLGEQTATSKELVHVQRAHAAVSARQPSLDPGPESVVTELPAVLDDHVARLRMRPAAEPYFNEGWSLGLVDLRYVHALLPTVFIDGGRERIEGVSSKDIASVASLTLPADTQTISMVPGFNPTNNTWTLSSDNPNLRVVGQTAGPVAGSTPGLLMVGFVVAELPSFMQVLRYENRWYLRDGYHRATSLLQAGIQLAPAFTRQSQRPEELTIAGGLPLSAVVGVNPPRLTDYFDESVSTQVRVPTSRKVVVIQALEVNALNVDLSKTAGPATD